jgi:hypothetical protein
MLLLFAACGGTADPPGSAPVVAVVVTPSESPPLRGGESFQFSAEAQDEDANPLPRPITWSMGSPDLATVSQTGLVTILAGTGHGSGSLTVVAATEGKQGGSVSSASTTTDSEGHASVSWTIGSADVSSVQAVSAFGIATFTAQGF